MKAVQDCDSVLPVDTDYVELSLTGLEEAKSAISQIGDLISSSCIPSLCIAGGEGLRKAVAGKRSVVSLSTRDSQGKVTAGPSLAELACHIEAVGGIKLGKSH